MELEFDKEMDAILRKARGGIAAGSPASGHIDADAIAAFAEGALPEKARAFYTTHFANCGRCRKLLSQSILARGAALAADGAAAPPVSALAPAAPWYSRFFRTPNLAVAMGALVLVFSGVLGYLVLQNRNSESAATVSQATDQRPMSAPAEAGPPASSNANIATNTSQSESELLMQESNSANADTSDRRRTTGPSPAGEERQTDKLAAAKESERSGAASEVTDAAKAVAPPQPGAVDEKTVGRTEKPAEPSREEKEKDDDDVAKKKAADESRARRDAPPPAAKAGPARSGSGPVQMQSNQVNTNVGEMPVTRSVRGKTFNNRDGAWYDSAYRGQATINITRGTDEFRKLDNGLRSIANSISGVVVVVWKDKAYRIR